MLLTFWALRSRVDASSGIGWERADFVVGGRMGAESVCSDFISGA
jgi:hypothetical protein